MAGAPPPNNAPVKRFGNVSREPLSSDNDGTAGGSASLIQSLRNQSSAVGQTAQSGTFGSGPPSSFSAVAAPLSSAELLHHMRTRPQPLVARHITGLPDVASVDITAAELAQHAGTATANRASQGGGSTHPLAYELHEYLLQHLRPDGSSDGTMVGVPSQQLIDQFAPRLHSETDQFLFRQLLRGIAKLTTTASGRKVCTRGTRWPSY